MCLRTTINIHPLPLVRTLRRLTLCLMYFFLYPGNLGIIKYTKLTTLFILLVLPPEKKYCLNRGKVVAGIYFRHSVKIEMCFVGVTIGDLDWYIIFRCSLFIVYIINIPFYVLNIKIFKRKYFCIFKRIFYLQNTQMSFIFFNYP